MHSCQHHWPHTVPPQFITHSSVSSTGPLAHFSSHSSLGYAAPGRNSKPLGIDVDVAEITYSTYPCEAQHSNTAWCTAINMLNTQQHWLTVLIGWWEKDYFGIAYDTWAIHHWTTMPTMLQVWYGLTVNSAVFRGPAAPAVVEGGQTCKGQQGKGV